MTKEPAPIETTGIPQRAGIGKVLLRALSGLVLVAVLAWRLPDFDAREMLPAIGPDTFAWLGVAVVSLMGAYLLQTFRWRAVIHAMDRDVPIRTLAGDLLAGEFMSKLLPTSFGGDVLRVWRLGRRLDDNPTAFAATALERLTGWVVLPLICGVALLLRPSLLHLGTASWLAVTISGGTLVVLAGLLVAAGLQRGGGRLVDLHGWRGWLGAVHTGVLGLRRHPTAGVRTLVAGVGFQLAQCLSVWACARALEIPQADLLAVCAFFPPTAIAQNLPIGLGGLGVRETAFVVFFGALGVSDARCIAFGLTVYVVFMVTSVIGAPSFVFGEVPGRRRAGRVVP